MARFGGAGAAQPTHAYQIKRIKYMFIVQRYGLMPPLAAGFLHRKRVSDRHRGGSAIRKFCPDSWPSPSVGSSNVTPGARFERFSVPSGRSTPVRCSRTHEHRRSHAGAGGGFGSSSAISRKMVPLRDRMERVRPPTDAELPHSRDNWYRSPQVRGLSGIRVESLVARGAQLR